MRSGCPLPILGPGRSFRSRNIMTLIENHRRSVFDFNRHDAAATAEAYALDAEVHDPSHTEPLRGRNAVREDYAALFLAFPDIRVDILEVMTSGRCIAYQLRLTGTHDGRLQTERGELPPGHRRLDLRGAVFAEANDEGQYTMVRRYYDVASLLQQLGIVPDTETV